MSSRRIILSAPFYAQAIEENNDDHFQFDSIDDFVIFADKLFSELVNDPRPVGYDQLGKCAYPSLVDAGFSAHVYWLKNPDATSLRTTFGSGNLPEQFRVLFADLLLFMLLAEENQCSLTAKIAILSQSRLFTKRDIGLDKLDEAFATDYAHQTIIFFIINNFLHSYFKAGGLFLPTPEVNDEILGFCRENNLKLLKACTGRSGCFNYHRTEKVFVGLCALINYLYPVVHNSSDPVSRNLTLLTFIETLVPTLFASICKFFFPFYRYHLTSGSDRMIQHQALMEIDFKGGDFASDNSFSVSSVIDALSPCGLRILSRPLVPIVPQNTLTFFRKAWDHFGCLNVV